MLLTRAPLHTRIATNIALDLHVLGTPPAFVLSQNQTLQLILQLAVSFAIPATRSLEGSHFRTARETLLLLEFIWALTGASI